MHSGLFSFINIYVEPLRLILCVEPEMFFCGLILGQLNQCNARCFSYFYLTAFSFVFFCLANLGFNTMLPDFKLLNYLLITPRSCFASFFGGMLLCTIVGDFFLNITSSA